MKHAVYAMILAFALSFLPASLDEVSAQQMYRGQFTSCPPGTIPVLETDNCVPRRRTIPREPRYDGTGTPMRGAVGTRRPPRDEEVPLPGSGRTVPTSAAAAASGRWVGCRPYVNRFKEPFQRCCRVDSAGLRSCDDVYR